MVYLTNTSQGGKKVKIDPKKYDNIETYASLDIIPVEEQVKDRLYFITDSNMYYRWDGNGFVIAFTNNIDGVVELINIASVEIKNDIVDSAKYENSVTAYFLKDFSLGSNPRKA